jgi:uncharacterized protein with PIN domain
LPFVWVLPILLITGFCFLFSAKKLPLFVTLENMEFLCDEMLKGLGRWLRAAGYDVAVEPDGTSDKVLLERARDEGRILLTRDRRFAEQMSNSEKVVLLDCNQEDDCIEELSEKLQVNWLYKPFTRCLACNTPLIEGTSEQWDQVPDFSRQRATRVLYCPSCEQLFWDGSHVKRMKERLERAAGVA